MEKMLVLGVCSILVIALPYYEEAGAAHFLSNRPIPHKYVIISIMYQLIWFKPQNYTETVHIGPGEPLFWEG